MLHYVVVRGTVPGVETDPQYVLKYIRGVKNSDVRVFPTVELANSFWVACLKSPGTVFPTAAPSQPRFSSRKISLRQLADTRIPLRGVGEQLEYGTVMRNFPKEWYHPAKQVYGKAIWIVASGRKPGLYESWPLAHEQIHGLKDANERYYQLSDYPSAALLFKRLASLGFVELVDPEDSEVCPDPEHLFFTDGDLNDCTRCLDVSDTEHPGSFCIYNNSWDGHHEDDFWYEENQLYSERAQEMAEERYEMERARAAREAREYYAES